RKPFAHMRVELSGMLDRPHRRRLRPAADPGASAGGITDESAHRAGRDANSESGAALRDVDRTGWTSKRGIAVHGRRDESGAAVAAQTPGVEVAAGTCPRLSRD